MLWLLPLTYANGGPIPLPLDGWGGSGIGTHTHLLKPARQWDFRGHIRVAGHRVYPSNNSPNQAKNDRKRFAWGIQASVVLYQLLGPNQALRCLDRGLRSKNGDRIIWCTIRLRPEECRAQGQPHTKTTMGLALITLTRISLYLEFKF